MEANHNNRGQFWIGMLVSLVCLAAVFFFIDPREIWAALITVRLDYLALMILGLILFLVIRTIRWRFMLGGNIPWMQVLHITNIGYMFNMTLPLRAGDVARAILIGNVPPVTLASGISTMVVERILDMLFIVTLLPFTLAFVPSLPGWMQEGARAFGIVAIAGILILIVAANQRPFAGRVATAVLDRLPFLDTVAWVRRIDALLAGLDSLTRLKDGLVLLFLSIVTWLPIIFAYDVGMRAVGIALTPAGAGFIVCAAALSVALPSSPGQIGVFHAGVIAALQVLGQPQAESASFAFVYHALNTALMIVLGLIGLSAIGATFSNVMASAQRFTRRQRREEQAVEERLEE